VDPRLEDFLILEIPSAVIVTEVKFPFPFADGLSYSAMDTKDFMFFGYKIFAIIVLAQKERGVFSELVFDSE
jgi:hypothetical protein